MLSFTATEDGLKMIVEAPFFNDPPSPGTKPGEPLYGLWNYEGTIYYVFVIKPLKNLNFFQLRKQTSP